MNTRPKIPANARNLNTCVIGSSGSGKTRFWLTPQLLQAHSSFVVVDPKGGVLSQVGSFLQKRVLPDPDEPMMQALRLRALAGFFGRVFIVRNSVPVKMMLFSNFGSIKGLMSFSVPHEAFCQVLF